MARVLLCTENEEFATQFIKNFEQIRMQCFIKKSKRDIFDYLNSHKTPTFLVLEAGFIDSEEFLTLLHRRYSWAKVLVFSDKIDENEVLRYKDLHVKAFLGLNIKIYHLKDALKYAQEDRFWSILDVVDEKLTCKSENIHVKIENESLGRIEQDLKIVARYSGCFNEYEISTCKNLEGFMVVNDTIKDRDGSDVIDANLEKLIFSDVEIWYKDINQNI